MKAEWNEPLAPDETLEVHGLWDSSGVTYDLGMTAGSIWGLLFFLTLGLASSAFEEPTETVGWEFLLLGSAAFVGGVLSWMGNEAARRQPTTIALSLLAGGLIAAWYPLADGSARGGIALLSMTVLVTALAVSALLILPCLSRIVAPKTPLTGSMRMLAFAMFGFIVGGLFVAMRWPYAMEAMLGSVVLAGSCAGLIGVRRARAEQRLSWFLANAIGVGVLHMTFLLILATLVSSNP